MKENLIPQTTIKELGQTLYMLAETAKMIEQAQALGIDCAERDARCTHLKELALQMQAFFGRPEKGKKGNE